MSQTIRRSPVKMFTKVCENPKCPRKGGEFFAFRSTARYCSDVCRAAAHKLGYPKDTFRGLAVHEHGRHCSACGVDGEKRYFVWPHPLHPNDPALAFVLCGFHHWLLSATPEQIARRVRWLRSKGCEVNPEMLEVAEDSVGKTL